MHVPLGEDSNTCSYAAENGHLEILKWSRHSLVTFGNGCHWDSITCSSAALNGLYI